MPTERIKAHWESFNTSVVPGLANATQRADMRRAFYGGVAAAFRTLIEASDQPDGAAVMKEVHLELGAYLLEEMTAALGAAMSGALAAAMSSATPKPEPPPDAPPGTPIH